MAMSTFCLIPAGDSAVTDRLYTAMSAGCLPVIIADSAPLAFDTHIRYLEFALGVPMRNFIRHPVGSSLEVLRQMPRRELLRRQRRMAAHVADVLYDVEGSRVGSNFLREVAHRCLVHNSTRKYAGSSWARKCRGHQVLNTTAQVAAAAGVTVGAVGKVSPMSYRRNSSSVGEGW